MSKNKLTLKFGIAGAIAALLLGYLGIGFYFIYVPPLLAALITIVLFTTKIDAIKPKRHSAMINIIFGMFIAIATLLLATLSGSLVVFIMATAEFYFPELVDLGITIYKSSNYSFGRYFEKDGAKLILAPLFWVMLYGFIPSLIFGLFYGVLRHRNAKNI